MAAALSPADIKTLEQTRQRLSQLTNSLASLQAQILNSDPLPPWPSLHSQTLILSQLLASLSTHLSPPHQQQQQQQQQKPNSDLLSRTQTYPLPLYPGREQEGLLGQLLRKKLEVGVAEWVEEGRKVGEEVLEGEKGMGMGRRREIEEMWEWAGMKANEEARGVEWGGGDGEEEEEEEEEEEAEEGEGNGGLRGQREEGDGVGGSSTGMGMEEEEVGGPPMPLEDILRFMTKGGG